MKRILFICTAALFLHSCGSEKPKQNDPEKDKPAPVTPKVEVPKFNVDTAYKYVKEQVDFGPRVPNTKEHMYCADYLLGLLSTYADTAFIQYGDATTWDKVKLKLNNIIGVFGKEKKKRITLSAHWDTRPWADKDSINSDKPILGANDGASGVGVLLEVARQLSLQDPELGVDIIFFDAEDWGVAEEGHSFCLGSQYWAKNPHDRNYYEKSVYGINLDMVGGKDALFAKEGESVLSARWLVDKVWRTGQSLGHNQFINYEIQGIVDDHYYVTSILKIPYIDIINYDVRQGKGFGDFWHTHADNMDIIDKETLKAVGETVLHVVYNESRK